MTRCKWPGSLCPTVHTLNTCDGERGMESKWDEGETRQSQAFICTSCNVLLIIIAYCARIIISTPRKYSDFHASNVPGLSVYFLIVVLLQNPFLLHSTPHQCSMNNIGMEGSDYLYYLYKYWSQFQRTRSRKRLNLHGMVINRSNCMEHNF